MLAENILSSREFDKSSNNYANSEIRKWLNGEFFNGTFSEEQKSIIQTVTVDNSADSTTDTKGNVLKSTKFACENTIDKVWLLSAREAANTSYGFNADYCNGKDPARQKEGTSYAKSQGLGMNSNSGKGRWWLRSPDYCISKRSWCVNSDGHGNRSSVNSTYCGVVPALKIRLEETQETKKSVFQDNNESTKNTVTNAILTRNGNMVYFGQYPQSEVTDNSLKKTLSNLAGTLPTSSNGNGWTSYKYYIWGSNSTDFMWYKDVIHNGERYRGVYFTQYRPYFCDIEYNTNQKDNGYTTSTLYWFKYEPIQWRILEEKNGYATLLAEEIIDSQQYNVQYNNKYAQSDIRAWLNGQFYRTAFTSEQQNLIQAVTVDNSERSTNLDRDATEWDNGKNDYACENTTDKVWLLSEQEVTKSAYGFDTASGNYDTVRRKSTSDYAKSQGAYTETDEEYEGKGVWWLRSPCYYYGSGAWCVDYDGNSGSDHIVNDTNAGAVPALKIKLS